ncbi:DUF3068 domain-containing protein [Kribbia dieselivorans]|uniref:DUF3068 domain-containing protein n=1 Tax=Kribbia dieselivorans TaxID=331526 RepID=UPI000837C7A1|nr:DUF3068 domain-containing protein [Kribbia dieselivorans]
MSRVIGVICVALGALLIVFGLLARPYVYTNLAVLSLDQEAKTVSRGEGVDAVYPHRIGPTARLDKLTGVTVVSTRTVQGIPGKVEAAGKDKDNAFWQTTVRSQAEVGGQLQDLSYSDEGVSLDRRSGEATNCCGDYRSTGDLEDPDKTEPVTHEGYFFKLPFNAQKQDYPWWDGDLQASAPAKFDREETLNGLPTYVYVQTIPEQTVGAPRQVPRSLFGDSKPGNFAADVHYTNTRTLWVEPETGSVVKGQEEIARSLVVDGQDPVYLVKGTLAYTDETVKENVDKYASSAKVLSFIRGPLLPVGLIGGILLLLLGVFLFIRDGRARHGA